MSEPITDEERAQGIVDSVAADANCWPNMVAAIAAALAEVRRETVEACAAVSERHGCGRPGCKKCMGEIIAAAIRALASTGQGGSGR